MATFKEGFADKLQVPAGATDVQVFDDELPGFGVRKFASGAASYFVKYAVGTQQRRKSLGRVVKGNLKEMRLAASKILAQARLGTDVVAEAKAAGKPVVTLGSLVPIYLAAREKDLREKSFAENDYLTKTWKPLHGHAIDGVTRRDIVAIIDTMQPVAGDRAKSALSGLYAWAIDKGYLDINPTMNIRARGQNGGRTRTLAEPELAVVWNACGDDDFGRIIKLLILLGQRKTEIGDLAWGEIDLDKGQIQLAERRTKNKRGHIIPLSEQARAIIEAVPRESRDLLFGRGAGGYGNWTGAKRDLDARIAARTGKPLAAWVIHDLRRSFVTHIGENGFSLPHVTEAILNHVSGTKSGVAGIYNKALNLPERRQALALWGAHVAALVSGGTSKVIPLRKVAT